MAKKIHCPKCREELPRHGYETYRCYNCEVIWRITIQATAKLMKVGDIHSIMGRLSKEGSCDD